MNNSLIQIKTDIIMDDGKGTKYCYAHAIPLINALLVPKIFWYSGQMNFNTYPEKWRRRAMAFAVRAHNHLWGKNNEDPLVFLYNQGWSHEFSKQMYLGWNKFGQERPYDKWGINKPGSFFIPPGIVFPYIIKKELISLFIIPIENPKNGFCFPGNPDRPLILGNPDNSTKTVNNIIQGLCLFQENPGIGIKICV